MMLREKYIVFHGNMKKKQLLTFFGTKNKLIIFYIKDCGFQPSIFIFFIPSYWRWLNKSYSKKAIVI